jgi:acyl-CoA thioester hydrolase
MTDLWELSPEERGTLRPEAFPVQRTIPTRWRDNDSYGHVNNAVYFEYFDTAINGWMLENLGDSADDAQMLLFVAESRCRYLSELAFPTPVTVGAVVHRLGRTSLTYDLAVFGRSGTPPAALGRWVHVAINPSTRRPIPLSSRARDLATAAQELRVPIHEEGTRS